MDKNLGYILKDLKSEFDKSVDAKIEQKFSGSYKELVDSNTHDVESKLITNIIKNNGYTDTYQNTFNKSAKIPLQDLLATPDVELRMPKAVTNIVLE